MAKKIRCNDTVCVITGREKSKRGRVKKFLSQNRIIVEGINLVKKHQKPIPSMNKPGKIFEKESAIHISNVAIFNPSTNKCDRVGFRIEKNKKVRFFKSNQALID